MLREWLRRRRAGAVAPVAEAAGGGVFVPLVRAAAPFRLPSLASATREYAQAVDAGTADRLGAADLARLRLVMGSEIWNWQYARRLTGQAPWRAAPAVEERVERLRSDRQMTADIETWNRAVAELDAEVERALLYGKPAPEPLIVPAAVRAVIEARRQAALDRAERRRRGQAGGSGRPPPVPAPDEALRPPSPSI